MKIRLVVADDHVMLRNGLCTLLDAEAELLVVGEANNGHEAISLVRELRPDVAILDIAMSELNGIEATRQIRSEGLSTQIIILSMYATNRYIRQALQAGAQGYVLKDAAAKELVQAIQTVMAGQRYLSRKVETILIEDYISHPYDLPEGDLAKLNNQERRVLQLVVEGKSSIQIASQLHLSPKTVDKYRGHIMQKLNIHDLPSLVKFAIQQGVLSLE